MLKCLVVVFGKHSKSNFLACSMGGDSELSSAESLLFKPGSLLPEMPDLEQFIKSKFIEKPVRVKRRMFLKFFNQAPFCFFYKFNKKQWLIN